MKLTSALIDQTLQQFDARPIPDDHPATRHLNELYGEHTFFLDDNGLNIVEPSAPVDRDPDDFDGGDLEAGRIVKLAGWADEFRTSLAPHERKFTGVIVLLRKAA
jgi:hypothetical protein